MKQYNIKYGHEKIYNIELPFNSNIDKVKEFIY